MKKFLVVLSVLLFAAGAFAQDAAKMGPTFKYEFFGLAYGITGSQKDFAYDYSHIRVRPFFTVGNENVKGVVRLEIDQDFGVQATDAGADPGTDNKVVEVKWAYIEVADMLVQGFTFKAGLAGYYFPLVTDNDFAMYQGAFDFGMGKAILSYIKRDEYAQETTTVDAAGVKTDNRNDVEIYAVDLPIKAGAISIRPGFMYFKGGKEATVTGVVPFQELAAYNAALNFNADFGVVAVDATAAYLGGESKPAGVKEEYAAYAADVLVSIKASDMLKAGLFFTIYSGDDDLADDKTNNYRSTMNAITGWAPDGRLLLLDQAGIHTNGGTYNFSEKNNTLGLWIYGANVEAKMDKLTLFGQVAYVTTDKDYAAGKSYIGTEIDFKVNLDVAPKTGLFAEFGYVVAGDDMAFGEYAKAENAYQVAWGIKTSI